MRILQLDRVLHLKRFSVYVLTELEVANTSDFPDAPSVYTHYKPIFT